MRTSHFPPTLGQNPVKNSAGCDERHLVDHQLICALPARQNITTGHDLEQISQKFGTHLTNSCDQMRSLSFLSSVGQNPVQNSAGCDEWHLVDHHLPCAPPALKISLLVMIWTKFRETLAHTSPILVIRCVLFISHQV